MKYEKLITAQLQEENAASLTFMQPMVTLLLR